MIHKQETEVLVVGAGPVGMMTALLLAGSDIAVRIIDKEPRPATHSYACGLHPRSLAMLERVGLLPAVLERGRRLDRIALYEGSKRQAELHLSELPSAHPFLIALPQNELEDLLAEKLRATQKAKVEWDHRLSDLAPEGDKDREDTAAATVCKMGESSAGYSVPVLERVVQKTLRIRADLIVGTDGHASHVRQELGIDWEPVAAPEFFALYDFETEGPVADEVRMVFDQGSVSAMWPLPGNRCRWCVQVTESELSQGSEDKDRESFLMEEEAFDPQTRHHVEEIIRQRAPWFETSVRELDWSAGTRFTKGLARRFGRSRCWLAGDAAHQGGPVGMQSMNVGLHEAGTLAEALRKVLREGSSPQLLETYETESRDEWRRMLGLEEGCRTTAQAAPWVQKQPERILNCLPASGPELVHLGRQLGLQFEG